MLKPIGEEYWEVFPLGNDTEASQTRILFQVTEHSAISTPPFVAAKLKPLRIQKRPITGFTEKLEPTFGEWEDA